MQIPKGKRKRSNKSNFRTDGSQRRRTRAFLRSLICVMPHLPKSFSRSSSAYISFNRSASHFLSRCISALRFCRTAGSSTRSLQYIRLFTGCHGTARTSATAELYTKHCLMGLLQVRPIPHMPASQEEELNSHTSLHLQFEIWQCGQTLEKVFLNHACFTPTVFEDK